LVVLPVWQNDKRLVEVGEVERGYRHLVAIFTFRYYGDFLVVQPSWLV
jgi:hypothetical protein